MLFFELFPLLIAFVALVVGVGLFVMDLRARQDEAACRIRIDQDVTRTQPVPLSVRQHRRRR